MKAITIPVSKKVDGKYEKQGEVNIVVPVLEDIQKDVVGAKVTGDEEGLPVYDSDIANWVQSAILAYVKATTRNKLVSGTAQVKPGMAIPTDWAGLLAEGERGGNGAALALLREFKEAFAKWAATLGKNAATTQALIQYVSNRTALQLANSDHKAKIKGYVEQFAEQLSEEDLERFTRPLENVMESCAAEAVDF